jgi:hypothetical protein
MRSMPSRNHQRLSGGEWLRSTRRPSAADQASASSNGTHVSNRSDIHARPDVYDMEYEGASNEDAHFFARLLARGRPRRVLELACGSGRVTFIGITGRSNSSNPSTEVMGRSSSAATTCPVLNALGSGLATKRSGENARSRSASRLD